MLIFKVLAGAITATIVYEYVEYTKKQALITSLINKETRHYAIRTFPSDEKIAKMLGIKS
jgi:exopolysaccharide biosynthesis protein